MAAEDAKERNRLVIRSWPKMIFLYPTAVISLFMGLATYYSPDHAKLWGAVFMIILAMNLVVLTFEFPRATSLLVTFAVIIVVLGMVLVNMYVPFIPVVNAYIKNVDVSAAPGHYFVMFLIQLLLFVGMYFVTRFDYWVLTPNELIRHHGVLGDVERFSTAGLKLNKEIQDIFEYVLCGAGRVVMNVPGNARPIILDNVLFISKVEDKSNRILDARVVRLESDGTPSAPPAGDDVVQQESESG